MSNNVMNNERTDHAVKRHARDVFICILFMVEKIFPKRKCLKRLI